MNFYFFLIAWVISRIQSKFTCSKCNNEMVGLDYIYDKESSVAISKSKRIYGGRQILQNKFKNPQEIYFEVFTSLKANLRCDNIVYDQTSFFHGYGWSLCYCPVCMTHHGWLFHPIDRYCDLEIENSHECKYRTKFFGIITDNVSFKEGNKKVFEQRVEL
jgi:hypothetical protein